MAEKFKMLHIKFIGIRNCINFRSLIRFDSFLSSSRAIAAVVGAKRVQLSNGIEKVPKKREQEEEKLEINHSTVESMRVQCSRLSDPLFAFILAQCFPEKCISSNESTRNRFNEIQ